MSDWVIGVAFGFAVCAALAAWMAAMQAKYFTGQLETLSKTAQDGLECLRQSLKDTREALHAKELDRRSEYARANMLEGALEKRLEQVKRLESEILELHTRIENKDTQIAAADRRFQKACEDHFAEVAGLQAELKKCDGKREALQICIDAFAEAAVFQGVNLEREFG